jgi:hypothetical protein
MKIGLHLLGVGVLCLWVPALGWAEPPVMPVGERASSASRLRELREPRPSKNPGRHTARPSALRGSSVALLRDRSASGLAMTMPAKARVVTIPHGSSGHPQISSLAGAAGSPARRRFSIPAALGGPKDYDARDGALVGGAVARRKP